MAALVVALSACAVGPDYHAPISRLESFKNAPAAHERVASPSVTLDAWWVGFDDPVLTQIIRRALDQNLDLVASLARVGKLGRRRARRAPNLHPRPISLFKPLRFANRWKRPSVRSGKASAIPATRESTTWARPRVGSLISSEA